VAGAVGMPGFMVMPGSLAAMMNCPFVMSMRVFFVCMCRVCTGNAKTE